MSEVRQCRGTSVVVTEDHAHRVIDRGSDPLKLGRWSWVLIQGKGTMKLRVVSGCRPCDAKNDEGSVMHQHFR